MDVAASFIARPNVIVLLRLQPSRRRDVYVAAVGEREIHVELISGSAPLRGVYCLLSWRTAMTVL